MPYGMWGLQILRSACAYTQSLLIAFRNLGSSAFQRMHNKNSDQNLRFWTESSLSKVVSVNGLFHRGMADYSVFDVSFMQNA